MDNDPCCTSKWSSFCVDEVNACLGIVRLHSVGDTLLDSMLARIQNELFDLGADLATPQRGAKPGVQALRITEAQVARLERNIDHLNAELSPLNSFVLPGGSPAQVAFDRLDKAALLTGDVELGPVVGRAASATSPPSRSVPWPIAVWNLGRVS